MADSISLSASDSPLLLQTVQNNKATLVCSARQAVTVPQSALTHSLTDILHETAVGSNVLGVRNEIELERILLLAILCNKRLLFFYHARSLSGKDHCGVDCKTCRLLMPLPHIASDQHMLVERQALTLASALIGSCI